MDTSRFYRYRAHDFGPRWLIYQYLLTDAKLRHALGLGLNCAVVTFLTLVMSVVILLCSLVSARAVVSSRKDFARLQKEADKKIPRKKSVTDIRPAYNCIHKHLQQTDVFHEKTRKMLCKERLELEILNSRIKCINKLLKPEEQSEWRQSRLPKVYYRPINSTGSK
ncbi:uncharacterized protein LOC143177402 [Calliopsis andreniformis]|uniref:uncharacterized protein LOC143177402 n=1 Tax=Calliopsis andreniformis TaxID=337506 RepID=UPI003FCE80AB